MLGDITSARVCEAFTAAKIMGEAMMIPAPSSRICVKI
jgi:hypothetical protein